MKPRIEKTPLVHGRTKPDTRNVTAHLRFVRSLSCAVSNVECVGPMEAAHVRAGLPASAQKGGMGMKPADRWTVSLCNYHHYQQHNYRDGEIAWWANEANIDPVALAERLWRVSGDNEKGLRAISRAKTVREAK